MKKMLLIMNPNAGLKKANKYLTDILMIFAKHDYEVTVCLTQKSGDATEYAKTLAASHDLAVCIGGDGTFNETIEGIVDSNCGVPVGYIPSGSTNDFAASMGLSRRVLTAAEDVVTGIERKIDIGKFNDRYFSYVASFGAFTKVSYTTSQDLKNVLGHMAYVLEGIKDLPTIRAEHIRLETENGSIDGDYIFGAICNSTSLGGILTINPDVVDMNDGLFEILLVRLPRNIIELNNIIFALNNHDYSGDMITFLSASHAEIFASAQMAWTLDGEFMNGSDKIVMQNIHDAIRIIVPGEK